MADSNLVYHVDSLYRLAFPDLASKVLTRLDGARDLVAGKVLGNGYHVPTEDSQPAPQLDFSGINVKALVQGDELSYLGTPIFQPITFLGGQYQQLGIGAKAGQVVMDDYVSWRLPETATAEFRRAKEVEKSRPNAAFGSTKEMWAFNDWEVTIRGFIIDSQPNFFPQGQLREMLRWEKIADSIEVAGDMLTYTGITRLLIESFSISKMAGMPNVIPFQMACVSDEPLELSILSNTLKQ